MNEVFRIEPESITFPTPTISLGQNWSDGSHVLDAISPVDKANTDISGDIQKAHETITPCRCCINSPAAERLNIELVTFELLSKFIRPGALQLGSDYGFPSLSCRSLIP